MNDEQTLTQPQHPTFLGRLGSFFRRSNRIADLTRPEQLPALLDAASLDDAGTAIAGQVEPRTTFLRPWSRREASAEQLQTGVSALSELMVTIKEGLEQHSRRQDELMTRLAGLPESLQSLPETIRAQGEAVRAIQQQIERQGSQQGKLADVLERIHRADGEDRRALEAIQDRVDTIGLHEEAISRGLTTVGSAMQAVSRTSEGSALVIEQLRDSLSTRDTELERAIRKQNTRIGTMLAVAIGMSVIAVTAVAVFGYLGYETLGRIAH